MAGRCYVAGRGGARGAKAIPVRMVSIPPLACDAIVRFGPAATRGSRPAHYAGWPDVWATSVRGDDYAGFLTASHPDTSPRRAIMLSANGPDRPTAMRRLLVEATRQG
jgi:hypothetical protein